MNLSLAELIAIALDLKTVYAAYETDAADGRITFEEGLGLAGAVIAVLTKHNVTLAQLQDILGGIQPLLALLPKR
jgi:hypothetical protein